MDQIPSLEEWEVNMNCVSENGPFDERIDEATEIIPLVGKLLNPNIYKVK